MRDNRRGMKIFCAIITRSGTPAAPRRGNRPCSGRNNGIALHHRGHLRRPASHAHGGWRPCVRAGAEGHLFCFAGKDGAIVWQKDFKKAYNLKSPSGTAAHPLVDGDRLICVVGGAGTTAWPTNAQARNCGAPQAGNRIVAGHPHLRRSRQLIFGMRDAVVLNPQTGKVYWSVPLRPTFGMSIGCRSGGQPVVRRVNRLRLSRWRRTANRPNRLARQHGVAGAYNTAFLADGHLYACGNGGTHLRASCRWRTHLEHPHQPPANGRELGQCVYRPAR